MKINRGDYVKLKDGSIGLVRNVQHPGVLIVLMKGKEGNRVTNILEVKEILNKDNENKNS